MIGAVEWLGFLLAVGALIAVETNGSVERPSAPLWITVSPKQPRTRCALTRSDEIRVVVPAHDPAEWLDFPTFHRYVSPCDGLVGSVAHAVAYVRANPMWRLSTQTHKAAGFR